MMIRSVLEIYLKDILIAWIGVNGVSDREMNEHGNAESVLNHSAKTILAHNW